MSDLTLKWVVVVRHGQLITLPPSTFRVWAVM
jgi:hypothetical protein